MRRWISAIGVAVVLAFGAAACGDDTTETPTTPTAPTTVTQTETFTGTLTASETKSHTFAVRAGLVTATLTTLTPEATTPIGFSMGTFDGLSCNSVVQNPGAVQGNQLVGTASSSAVICLQVYDVGNLTDKTLTYTVTAQFQVAAGS